MDEMEEKDYSTLRCRRASKGGTRMLEAKEGAELMQVDQSSSSVK